MIIASESFETQDLNAKIAGKRNVKRANENVSFSQYTRHHQMLEKNLKLESKSFTPHFSDSKH